MIYGILIPRTTKYNIISEASLLSMSVSVTESCCGLGWPISPPLLTINKYIILGEQITPTIWRFFIKWIKVEIICLMVRTLASCRFERGKMREKGGKICGFKD